MGNCITSSILHSILNSVGSSTGFILDSGLQQLSITAYGQSNIDYWVTRGTPKPAIYFLEQLGLQLGITTGTFNLYNIPYDDLGFISGDTAATWATATSYVAGNYVYKSGSAWYKCITSHNSSTLNINSVSAWVASTAYTTSDYVQVNNSYYKCATNHTSDASAFTTDLAAGRWTKMWQILNTIQVIHDGTSDIDATDYNFRYVNCASGGSTWIDVYGTQEVNPATSSSATANHWWNTIDNSSTTGYVSDTAGTPGFMWRRAVDAATRWPSQLGLHSHGGTDAAAIGSDSAKKAVYKGKLSDFVDAMGVPYFVGHHAHHNRDSDAGYQTIRELQTELSQEKEYFYRASNESHGRLAVGAYVAGSKTTNGSNVLKVTSVSAIGGVGSANKGIVGSGIQEDSYVGSVSALGATEPGFYDVTLVSRSGVSRPATITATGVTIGVIDDVHLYPGASEPLDTAGNTTHDTSTGFYDYAYRFIKAIVLHFTTGTSQRAFGPYVSAVTASPNTSYVDLTITHEDGTTLTTGRGVISSACAPFFRVEYNGVVQTISDVSLEDDETIRLTLANPIFDGTLDVWTDYGAMNRTNYLDRIVDNSTHPVPLRSYSPVTHPHMSITVAAMVVANTAYDINSSVVAEWNAERSESYSGSGSIWANIAPPYAGSLQSDYNLQKGGSPTFTGTPGTDGAYFLFDNAPSAANQYFELVGSNTTFLNNLARTDNTDNFWILIRYYPSTTSNSYLFSTLSSTTQRGVAINTDTDTQMLQVGDAGTQATKAGGTITATAWYTALWQYNKTTTFSGRAINTNVITTSQFGTTGFNTCTDVSSQNLHIGSRSDGASYMQNGSRISHVIIGTGLLTDSQLQDLLNYL